MNKKLLIITGVLITVALCSCSKKLTSLDASYFKTTPSPLEVKTGKVDATVTGSFPVKYFAKKAEVTVTPVLKFQGQEVSSESKTFQGEKVLGNNQIISYKTGGSYSLSPSFNYTPEMNKSELYLQFKVVQGKKTYTIPDVKVADGVLATSQLVSTSPDEIRSAIAPNNFQRITKETQKADILFLIEQSQLRKTELDKGDILAFNEKLKDARDAQNKEVSLLEVLGYASPDGSVALNADLAEKREKVTADYINSELKKLKADVTIDSKFTAEDWAGFQQLMEVSNIQDKDLILRVLSMYQDPEQREREIKNLSHTFQEVAQEILPQLRRSRINLTVDVIGKSDAEIVALAKSSPKELTAEELLYAATLVDSYKEKAQIYDQAIDIYPEDERFYVNLGVVRYELDEINESNALFKRALAINPNSPDANYNCGLVNLTKGNPAEAQVYFGKAAGTTGDLESALGASYLIAGDYTNAQKVLNKVSTNNAALSQILNSDYNAARTTLTSVAEPNAATAYLAAIVAARTNDRDGVYSNLKTAVEKNKSNALRAATDLEFSKYFTDQIFLSIIK